MSCNFETYWGDHLRFTTKQIRRAIIFYNTAPTCFFIANNCGLLLKNCLKQVVARHVIIHMEHNNRGYESSSHDEFETFAKEEFCRINRNLCHVGAICSVTTDSTNSNCLSAWLLSLLLENDCVFFMILCLLTVNILSLAIHNAA